MHGQNMKLTHVSIEWAGPRVGLGISGERKIPDYPGRSWYDIEILKFPFHFSNPPPLCGRFGAGSWKPEGGRVPSERRMSEQSAVLIARLGQREK
jgi:hypothetical protein